MQSKNSVSGSFVTFPRKRPRISSLFAKIEEELPVHPLNPPSNAYKTLSNAWGLWVKFFPRNDHPLPAHHLRHVQERPAKHQQATDLQTIPSTETADALVEAKVADFSSGSHLLGHSPRSTSSTFSTNFPDPRESCISVERPISVENWAEVRTISAGKFFPTGIDQGTP